MVIDDAKTILTETSGIDGSKSTPAEKKSILTGGYSVFVAIFLGICLLPFVGMAWASTDSTSGSSEPVPMPEFFREDGSVNLYYLPELGVYFEDHFAYRNEAIDIDAHIRVTLFATSPTDQVVIGTDGWLYYGGTLNNYLGRHPMRQREADNIAFNLSLMQGYTQAKDAQFLFTVAPNKNSLYPEHMPYYLMDGDDPSMDVLKESLEAAEVNYLDAFALFDAEAEELYFHTDSHWNNEGALLVTNSLLDAFGKEPAVVMEAGEGSQAGDIESMLYPVTAVSESTEEISVGDWSYVGESASVEDATIETKASGEGSILMFRDSFANNLIPLMAPEFASAKFSKLIPYDFSQLDSLQPNYVVIERAQRHVGLLAENPPLMPAPRFKVESTAEISTDTTISISEDGGFTAIEGWVDSEFYGDEDALYIEIEAEDGTKTAYVPFRMSRSLEDMESVAGSGSDDAKAIDDPSADCGFKAFLPRSAFTEGQYTARILVLGGEVEEVVIVGSAQFYIG